MRIADKVTPALQTEPQHAQTQTITPRMQQAVRLLLMSSQEFNLEIRTQIDQNPFLEMADDQVEPTDDGESDASNETEVEAPVDEVADWSDAGPPAGNARVSAVDLATNAPSLRDHLLRQLGTMVLAPRDRAIATAVIHALDDDGYLRVTREELFHPDTGSASISIGEDTEEVGEADWEIAVRLVQSLDPRGVAARSLAECLLLQLDERSPDEEIQLARRIVAGHLDRVGKLDWSGLEHALGESATRITAAVARIKTLDPRPGNALAATAARAVVPDVTIRRVRGKWVARLNHGTLPHVRLNRMILGLYSAHRSECRTLTEQLREARWALSNIEQRMATIEQVANSIAARQQGFFEHGAIALKPMFLRDIAEELGMHESTVSRVTNNKYMATPHGVFELKYFFSRALPSGDGGPATTAVRELIREMLDKEPHATPLSDAEIARRLARRGLKVARRTVTKYRQQMRIPAVELRRAAQRLAQA
jgi:RNA polymerase sigma-54 factor